MSSNHIVLEAVPNVSEGRDEPCIAACGRALGAHGCSVLDVHSDADHNRSVFTLVGGPQELADSLLAGARTVVEQVDMRAHEGAHPCIGALDVVPIAYLRKDDRELAHDEALAVANRLAAELDLPVFVYGELASADHRRERAFFRDGGVNTLSARMASGELAPDFGVVLKGGFPRDSSCRSCTPGQATCHLNSRSWTRQVRNCSRARRA